MFRRGLVDGEALRKAMFGERYSSPHGTRGAPGGGEAVRVENLVVLGDHGELAVNNVSFSVGRGEVFAIAGVAGNGQRELVEALAGFRRASRGRIVMLGRDVTHEPPFRRALMGLALIPEDPFRQGVAMDLSLAENIALKLARRSIVSLDEAEELVEKAVKLLSIAAPSGRAPVRTLSGGNVQKVVVARELLSGPRVLVAYNPTRMLDEASASRVREMIGELASRGTAVILVSEDIEEAVGLGDRIAVMSRGRLSEAFPRSSVDVDALEKLMAE